MTDRREDREGTGRRASDSLPRLIDREAALDAARQACAMGEVLADERARVAREHAATTDGDFWPTAEDDAIARDAATTPDPWDGHNGGLRSAS